MTGYFGEQYRLSPVKNLCYLDNLSKNLHKNLGCLDKLGKKNLCDLGKSADQNNL